MGDEVMANDYGALFHSHLAHRENCFSCQFAKEKRYSDLTIGGFLEHSDFKTEYDSSMVIVNTDNGRQVFDKIKKDILYEKSYCNFYKNQPCLYHPIPKPLDYEKFWKDYTIYSMSQLIKKYATSEIKEKFHIEILRPGEKYE